jgi:hypothetical protein
MRMVDVDSERDLAADLPHTYRGQSTRGIAALFAFMGLLLLVAGIQSVGGPHESTRHLVAGWLLIGLTLVFFVWTIRVASMAVIAGQEGIRVRNWLRSHDITWGSIRRFAFGNEIDDLGLRELLSTPVLQTYVVLKDGRHVPMVGIQATRLNRRRSRALVQEILENLETDRQRFQKSDA